MIYLYTDFAYLIDSLLVPTAFNIVDLGFVHTDSKELYFGFLFLRLCLATAVALVLFSFRISVGTFILTYLHFNFHIKSYFNSFSDNSLVDF